MNLQPLRKNIIVLIEYYQDYLRFYYADGHSEIIQDSIHSYLHTDDKGYKRPIQVYNQELYPTQNKKDINCRWINLSYKKSTINFFMILSHIIQLLSLIQPFS